MPLDTTDGWDVVHRVVLPVDDPLTSPLYLEDTTHTSDLRRRSVVVAAAGTVSFATYFNAFPAGYWRRWTDARQVRLSVDLSTRATLHVVTTNAAGEQHRQQQEAQGTTEVILPLHDDVGWIWFEVVAHGDAVRVSDASWAIDGFATRTTRVAIAITTFNRPTDCVATLQAIARDEPLRARLDSVIVTDQGDRRVADADGFERVRNLFGDRLLLQTQPNLGGSGGFSRGMRDGAERPEASYVLLLDDDVIVEPEGILRAVQFADHVREPVIVGGHMLNLLRRTTLHTWGERVDLRGFWWRAVDPRLSDVDFARTPLASVREAHRVMSVDYNGWWMCLIPISAIERLGLALPIFIKWDDAEYSLRAKAAGIPTISLPGAAIWHAPWSDKDDTIDWQAYFHQRNRLIVALLHSPYRRGSLLPWLSWALDVKHLVAMQYSVAALRHRALVDVLSGPAHLHPQLPTIGGEVRALRAAFADARPLDPVEVPAARGGTAARRALSPISGVAAKAVRAVAVVLRQSRRLRPGAQDAPEARLSARDARWWVLGMLDSAAVDTADGSATIRLTRDPTSYREMRRRSTRLHRELRRRWPELAREYRDAMPDLVSPETWSTTFASTPPSR